MDALALGALFRLVRVRRRLRQRDVGRRAGVSDVIVSRIEHGELGPIRHATLARVADALEIRLDYRTRWHAADVDRLASADHGLLIEAVAERLHAAGWEARPEVSFAIWGDRGSIDVLAWRASDRSLLVVEAKTEVVDVGETLRRLDVKARRAVEVAASIGWPDAARCRSRSYSSTAEPTIAGLLRMPRGSAARFHITAAISRLSLPVDGARRCDH